MIIMKFGGSSVRDFARIEAAARLIRNAASETRVAVVVSALGGVTDLLLDAARVSQGGDPAYAERIGTLRARHLSVVDELEDDGEQNELRSWIGERLGHLEMILAGVSLVHECTPRTLDKILSVGERLSARLMAAVLRQLGVAAEDCDARELIVTDRSFGDAAVDVGASYERIQAHFRQAKTLQVVTGFLAATADGETTTLGRGGSDYTASLLGAALAVERIEIWTDVDGVQSADPRRVEGAFPLFRLSYDELLELSHFGAKVVFPPTVHPARGASIPLLIKNSLNPAFPGTLVLEDVGPSEHLVRGISSIPRVALLRLEGDGMIGVPGIAGRLFHALAEARINVILISQASSEHSICLAVDPQRTAEARECIHREFARERSAGLIDDLVVDDDLSILAVVGAEMSHRPGISGRLFDALGRGGINVRAIAQGSSELNISFAVAAADETRALQTVHEAFFDAPRCHVFLLGVGGVGRELLRQIREASGLDDWSLSGVANSRRMSLDRRRQDCSTWSEELVASDPGSMPLNLASLEAFITATPGRRVLVDCTASEELGALYADLLENGVHVVTANKKPLTAEQALWDRLRDTADGAGRLYFEATVGAGLPVVKTLDDQLASGDRLVRVEGLFSGTLGFLMDRLRQGASFSDVLREADVLGFTEPDPREDLSGMDVARKLLILARMGGARLELEELEVVSLLSDPGAWDLELEELWAQLPALDDQFSALVEEASHAGGVLTYLARWDGSTARVGLETVPVRHPAASAVETENLFALTTARYRDRPLVIRGPGAGPEVTAAGVFCDLLRASERGAP